MDLAAKRRLGQGHFWVFLGRPGGMRGGRILRFAEAESDFGGFRNLQFGFCVSTRLSPARGWPYSIAPRIPPGREEGNRQWD